MVDAHVSGACVERHAGSSPVLGTIGNIIAEIAQLVEHNLAKVRVASSSLVFRSSKNRLFSRFFFFCSMATCLFENFIFLLVSLLLFVYICNDNICVDNLFKI